MSVQAVKRRLNLEMGTTTPSHSAFKTPRGKRRRTGSSSLGVHTPTKSKLNVLIAFFSSMRNYWICANFHIC